MNDALNTWNDFIIILIHELSLNSLMLIFREDKDINQSKTWKESFKLLNIQNESAIIELSNESIKFRSISIKSYYQNDHVNDELSLSSVESSIESSISSSNESSIESSIDSSIESISEHIDSIIFVESIKHDRDRLKKFSALIVNFIFNTIAESVVSSFIAFRQKEIIDLLEKEVFFINQ